MIEVKSVGKSYGSFKALSGVDFKMEEGGVYGLVGVNGAGKSTLLRIISGIYKADEGSVLIDGKNVYDDPELKSQIAFVPDDLYLPNNLTIAAMISVYDNLYGSKINARRVAELASVFELDMNKKFNTFSKGMRRQTATILALARETQYIFFDETFDGLDPFKRAYIKRLISEEAKERGATVIISSHSLRELEDVCDKLAVLNCGGLVFESDVADLNTGGVKVQIAFADDYSIERFKDFNVVDFSKQGSVAKLILKGDREDIEARLSAMSPILLEALPMTLEETFTYELGKRGVQTFEIVASGEGGASDE